MLAQILSLEKKIYDHKNRESLSRSVAVCMVVMDGLEKPEPTPVRLMVKTSP